MERIGICQQNAEPIKFKQADDKIIQSICLQSYENSIIQAILNMNLSQLSDKLQSVEKVIQFRQEKKLIGKIKSCRTCEHPCHLKKLCLEMSKYQMQVVHYIARRDVFLPVQIGHCSNIKIDISVVARDGYS